MRRPPSSPPPVSAQVVGATPSMPVSPGVQRGTDSRPLVTRFAWKEGDARLSYEVQVGVGPDEVLLVSLHRAPAPDQTGPAIARLVALGQVSGRGEIPLRPADIDDLKAGRLYVQLFTRAAPFGAARVPVAVIGLSDHRFIDHLGIGLSIIGVSNDQQRTTISR